MFRKIFCAIRESFADATELIKSLRNFCDVQKQPNLIVNALYKLTNKNSDIYTKNPINRLAGAGDHHRFYGAVKSNDIKILTGDRSPGRLFFSTILSPSITITVCTLLKILLP